MLISLGMALYGEDIRKKLPHIIIAAIVFAVMTHITRSVIEAYHIRTVLNTLFLFLVLAAIRINLQKALLASFTSMLSLLLAETLLVFTITQITSQPFEILLQNKWLQIILPWSYIIMLTALAFYLSKKNFSLLKLGNKLTEKTLQTRRGGVIHLAILILFLAVILGIINVGIISGKNSLGQFLHGWGIYVLTALIAIDIYLMIRIITRLFKVNEYQNMIQAQEVYLNSLEEVMGTLRAQRHDFINHLEVIHALHNQKNYPEEEKYLDKLLGEIGQVNSIVSINNPPLGALLNAKRLAAEGKGVNLEIFVDTSLGNLPMDTFVLVKILGNIIDNAVDAALESKDKLVEVEIERYLNNYLISIQNSGPIIEEANLKQIFEKGFTTKSGNHDGIGLSISKEIVESYSGEIKVKSTPEKGTVFAIVLPIKRM